MDANIIALITKAISVIETVAENKDLVVKAVGALRNIISKPQPTQADIEATEAELDALIDEFDAPLPAD